MSVTWSQSLKRKGHWFLSAPSPGLVAPVIKFREISSLWIGVSPTSVQTNKGFLNGLTICVVPGFSLRAGVWGERSAHPLVCHESQELPPSRQLLHKESGEGPWALSWMKDMHMLSLLGKPCQRTDYLPDSTSRYLQQVSIYSGLPLLDIYGVNWLSLS